MPKPTKKKRSRSEVAEERVRGSEVMLRKAALAYAEVAGGDPLLCLFQHPARFSSDTDAASRLYPSHDILRSGHACIPVGRPNHTRSITPIGYLESQSQDGGRYSWISASSKD